MEPAPRVILVVGVMQQDPSQTLLHFPAGENFSCGNHAWCRVILTLDRTKHVKLEHIGFVVESIEKFAQVLKAIGFGALTRPVADDNNNVNASFVAIGGNDDVYLEVLEPVGEASVVSGFLKRTGGGLHHLCFEVDDIEKTSKELEALGFKMVSGPALCPAYDENLSRTCEGVTKISFFLLPNRLLIELLEKGR
jgi:methylmalonyl-CoA/ethylmalonyl-CoA epimerase